MVIQCRRCALRIFRLSHLRGRAKRVGWHRHSRHYPGAARNRIRGVVPLGLCPGLVAAGTELEGQDIPALEGSLSPPNLGRPLNRQLS